MTDLAPQQIWAEIKGAIMARPAALANALKLTSALNASGIDAIAQLHCDRLSRQLRVVSKAAASKSDALSASNRAKLLAALDRINMDGHPISISKRKRTV